MRLKTLRSGLATLDTRRASAPVVERTRGRIWSRIRQRALERDKFLCVHCRAQGRVTMAQVVDHITPLSMGGRDNLENLQSLCKAHHDAKSAREAEARGGYKNV
jgi:5-methylcytosine-specific restriction enzyme A